MFNEWEECDSVGFTFSVLSGCHGKTKRAVLATFLHFLCQQIIAVLFQTDVPLSLVTWPTPPGGNMEMFLKIEQTRRCGCSVNDVAGGRDVGRGNE